MGGDSTAGKAATQAQRLPEPLPTDGLTDQLLNRELSWLDFNERVLQLAAEPDIPLLERVRFLSIFSSNLDEFFMVRVAGLIRQAGSWSPVRSFDGRTPRETLAGIRERVLQQLEMQRDVWSKELQTALGDAGITVGGMDDYNASERAELASLFERDIFPILTPLAVGPGQPFPYISGLSLSLALFVRDPKTEEERLARVKVPEGLPRLIPVGRQGRYVLLEDVIAHFLDFLFPDMEVLEQAVFRVTRDADFEVSDEADDLLEAVQEELRRRRLGSVVRLEVSHQMSRAMLDQLMERLAIPGDRVYEIESPLDLADAYELASLDRPELRYEPWIPVTPPRLLQKGWGTDLFAEVRRGDILVHLPYHSFATSVESFVRRASKDPPVLALKATVYRTSENSPLVPALVEAAEEGKQSVCLVELKARFDERRNIEWSQHLERAGVHVVYGFPDLKVHAKATLVVRREEEGLRRYVHIGTGNYHSATARHYEDFGLFSADEEITADVADLFNYLTGFGHPRRFRKILVAPFNLRRRLQDEIRSCVAAARAGRPARIVIKVNALTDPQLITELYRASEGGVQVHVIARSMCSLIPGVPGVSSNIRVRSVLGRFLEHSRVFLFEAGDTPSLFIGSADLMPRNLDQRIELVVPDEDDAVGREVRSVLDIMLTDTKLAWELNRTGSWERVKAEKDEPGRSSQGVLMERWRSGSALAPRKPRRKRKDQRESGWR